ncbi:MAG: hypothetical protein H5T64_00430 [Chloroflexi bacterium]|nr:hypothetical protein [Chloroflexota bacterium]
MVRTLKLKSGVAIPATMLAFLCVVMTYPLITALDSAIPDLSTLDAFEYCYKLWWFKHAIVDLHISPFFNSRVFYPFGYDFAMSETTLPNMVLALPITMMAGHVVGYNILVLFSFFLSALGAYLLVVYLTENRAAGMVAGAIYAFSPYRYHMVVEGVLPTFSTQWVPFLFLSLEIYLRRWRPFYAVLAGFFLALTALSSWYYGYMVGLFVPVYVVVRMWGAGRQVWRRILQGGILLAAVTFVASLPGLVPLLSVWGSGTNWSLSHVDWWSASLSDFVWPNIRHPLWGRVLYPAYEQLTRENDLYLGIVALTLAVVALRTRRDRTTWAYTWLSGLAGVLALGLTLHVLRDRLYIGVPSEVERVFTVGMGMLAKRLALNPAPTYYALRQQNAIYVPMPTFFLYLFLPFFNTMRFFARFGVLVTLGMSVLAGLGTTEVLRRVSRPLAVAGVLLALVLFEFAVEPTQMGLASAAPRAIDKWLAAQPGDFAVIEFPIDSALTGRGLFGTITHGKAIAYGYGTFYPAGFQAARAELSQFPSEASVDILRRWGVRYALVDTVRYGDEWPRILAELTSMTGLRMVEIAGQFHVYEVLP